MGKKLPLVEILGLDVSGLAALTRQSAAVTHRLPSGLTIWTSARMQGQDGTARIFALGELADNPPAFASAATDAALSEVAAITVPETAGSEVADAASAENLRGAQRQMILQALAACGGNVSKAARALQVSRGLILSTPAAAVNRSLR